MGGRTIELKKGRTEDQEGVSKGEIEAKKWAGLKLMVEMEDISEEWREEGRYG